MTETINIHSSAIIIPAYDPDERLTEYVQKLIGAGFKTIIIVDDGSDIEKRPIFDNLALMPECILIRHAVNLGKGRGLKNAFNTYLNLPNLSDYCGVITVDSDGQHTIEDVVRLSGRLASEAAVDSASNTLFLGSRDFDKENVPFKSRWGNKITRVTFSLLHGVRISDTQTGLRGIPTEVVKKIIDLSGERFEYETNMLIVAARSGVKIEEIPIETVYENNNAGTHFNPFRDSFAIYKLLFGTFFKYIISSLTSFLIDIAIFQFALTLLKSGAIEEAKGIIIATVIARILSSIYNYAVNRTLVFHSSSGKLLSFVKYYVLVIVQLSCSAGFVILFHNILGLPETVVKIFVDFILFIISYQIQKRLVFKK